MMENLVSGIEDGQRLKKLKELGVLDELPKV